VKNTGVVLIKQAKVLPSWRRNYKVRNGLERVDWKYRTKMTDQIEKFL